jgi:hypothetical protein
MKYLIFVMLLLSSTYSVFGQNLSEEEMIKKYNLKNWFGFETDGVIFKRDQPMFTNGMEGFKEFIMQKIKEYNPKKIKSDTIDISFTVATYGKIDPNSVSINFDIGEDLPFSDYLRKVIINSGPWLPAIKPQDSKPVRCNLFVTLYY